MNQQPFPVMTRQQMEKFIAEHRVALVARSSSRLMRTIAWFLGLLGNHAFLTDFWTTIGRTIYYPNSVKDDPLADAVLLEHEFVHVRQWERWHTLFSISYLLLPLPLGLAWFRWRWEREAYLVQLRHSSNIPQTIDELVQILWSGYGYPWPRTWMKRWFEKQVALGRLSTEFVPPQQ